MTTPNILELLKTADLDELRGQVTEKQAALDESTKAARAEIDALETFIKLADIAQNGKPERKAWNRGKRKGQDVAKETQSPPAAAEPRARSAPGGSLTLVQRAEQYLVGAGESTLDAICKGIRHDNARSLSQMMNVDSRFIRTDRGYRLKH